MASCAGAAEVTGSRKRKLGEVGDGLTQAEDVEQPELGKVSTPLLGGRGPEVEDTSDGAFGERGAPVSAMDAEDGDPQELIADDEDAEREADEPASEESEGAAPAPGPDDPDEPRIQMFAPRPSGPVGAGAQQAAGHERAGTQRRAPPVGDPRPGPVSTLTRLTQAGVLALGETLRYESNGKGEVISGAQALTAPSRPTHAASETPLRPLSAPFPTSINQSSDPVCPSCSPLNRSAPPEGRRVPPLRPHRLRLGLRHLRRPGSRHRPRPTAGASGPPAHFHPGRALARAVRAADGGRQRRRRRRLRRVPRSPLQAAPAEG